MLIGLFALLSILLSNGRDSPFLNPDIEKVLKEVIVDDDRKKEVLTFAKEYGPSGKLLISNGRRLSKKESL